MTRKRSAKVPTTKISNHESISTPSNIGIPSSAIFALVLGVFILWFYSADYSSDPLSITNATLAFEKTVNSSLEHHTENVNHTSYTIHDLLIQDNLKEAFYHLNTSGDPKSVVKLFARLTKTNPDSVQAHYGLAVAIFKLAEQRASNVLLQKCIDVLATALQCPDISGNVYREIASLRAKHLVFFGKNSQAIDQWQALAERYPSNVVILNAFGTAHCVNERVSASRKRAKEVFEKVLTLDSNNCYALAHLGYILAVYEKDAHAAAPLLVKALEGSDDEVLQSARFYIHAGESLYRSGQKEEAKRIFKLGAERGIFLSELQRSVDNIDRLTGRPWWELSQLPDHYQHHLKRLREHWLEIRDEGLALVDSNTGMFMSESENLKASGEWKQFTLFQQGKESKSACNKAPKTCKLIRPFTEATENKRGQIKFSLLFPQTVVWPHTGPTNCRLRPHLGLKIPPGAAIKAARQMRSWKEGDFIILDDSFEHEVWHNGTEPRLILIVDVWHPELTPQEKISLSPL